MCLGNTHTGVKVVGQAKEVRVQISKAIATAKESLSSSKTGMYVCMYVCRLLEPRPFMTWTLI